MTPLIYAAMDRLNAVARSPGAPKAAIYALKRSLITLADEAGHAQHRLVLCADLTCLSCRGTGGCWGAGKESAEDCRSCSGLGKKTLRFLETTLWCEDQSWIWHSPVPCFGLDELVRRLRRWGVQDRQTAWRPLQPAVPYADPAELVADLLVLEELLGAQDYRLRLEEVPAALRKRWEALHPPPSSPAISDDELPF